MIEKTCVYLKLFEQLICVHCIIISHDDIIPILVITYHNDIIPLLSNGFSLDSPSCH